MCLSIKPKYAVSNGVGYIKGKSAIIASIALSRIYFLGPVLLGLR